MYMYIVQMKSERCFPTTIPRHMLQLMYRRASSEHIYKIWSTSASCLPWRRPSRRASSCWGLLRWRRYPSIPRSGPSNSSRPSGAAAATATGAAGGATCHKRIKLVQSPQKALSIVMRYLHDASWWPRLRRVL